MVEPFALLKHGIFFADGPENVDDIYKTWNLEEAAATYPLVCDFDENGNMEYQWYNGTVSVENRINTATAQNYSLQKSQYSHVSMIK